MKTVLNLPPKLVWAMGDEAEAQGMTLSQYVETLWEERKQRDQSAAWVPITERYLGEPDARRAVLLVQDGYDDGSISVALGVTRYAVAQWRRRAGLRPNRRGQVNMRGSHAA